MAANLPLAGNKPASDGAASPVEPAAATSRRSFAIVAALAFALGALAPGIVKDVLEDDSWSAQAMAGPQTRSFQLDIEGADLPMGDGTTWHAWTFNGTVPGPTLTANVGDRIRVTVTNKMDLMHSFHTHLSPYGLESDGSQLNIITGTGYMAMIHPGDSYTYEFVATIPGLFYYHCHSADGGHGISQHMAQGLYGAILVKGPEEIPVDDQVLFMAERGFDADDGAPYYIMNGHGLPGGEHRLEEIFAEGGADAVVAQFGKTLPVISGKVGEPVRLSVVNIGDMIHSFHMHAMTAYYVDHDKGEPVPAQVLGLLPGEADRILITPTEPGVWLFHCHVVSHADAGMIGVFVVEA